MNMTDWAKQEVEIACTQACKEGEEDCGYFRSCCESALKAHKSLMEDGHSGFSIGMTKQILIRLIEGRPLTPIDDTDDVWKEVPMGAKDYLSYQCKRMSSLFKHVYDDGTVKYSDTDSYYCVDVSNPSSTYSSGLVRKIVEEMFPITMPYYPGKPIAVYCEDFLCDPKNGDFDTVGIFHAIKPDGEKIDISRYFKESDDGWKEITVSEYLDREKNKV